MGFANFGLLGSAGIALLELTIVAGVLMLLIAGIVDIGLLIREQQAAADAARHAARVVERDMGQTMEGVADGVFAESESVCTTHPSADVWFPNTNQTPIETMSESRNYTCLCGDPPSPNAFTLSSELFVYEYSSLKDCSDLINSDCSTKVLTVGDSFGNLAKQAACRHLCQNDVNVNNYTIRPEIMRGVDAMRPTRKIRVRIQKNDTGCTLCSENLVKGLTPEQSAVVALKTDTTRRCWNLGEVSPEYRNEAPCDTLCP